FLFVVASTVILCAGIKPPLAAPKAEPALYGYSNADAQTEQQWEAKFRAIPEAANVRANDKYLSAYPHNAGSKRDEENAQWILSKFKQWGWDAHIETFYVLLPMPKERLVEMVSPTVFKARLQEPPIKGDPTSYQQKEQLPTYNMYSADGDVKAPVVYVNYGMPADYEELARLGISVKGAIVIARYGEGWRGLKPKLAAEHGAVGCLIYSDPRDDGYWHDDVFPKGPWRPREGVQRGSVMDMTLYPGDPLTPGLGATKNARRLPLKEAKTITKIPVLPLSYGDALPLLRATGGPVAPAGWRGALGITYHSGPGPARVHLKLVSSWNIQPIHDVIARIPGSQNPGEWIIRGNHQDAWVNGAEDPVSGISAELEEARALGELLKQGWKPRRTIIYCAWDGEEEGLLGSTEWAEEHAGELRQHAVVYINSDSNARGYLQASGSPSLQKFVDGVAEDIEDPQTHLTVEKRLRLHRIAHAQTPEERKALRAGGELKIGALGSGSDYSAFLDHLTIASLDLSYGSNVSGGGVYHSIYDDFYWYTHFGDPTFEYGRALAQTDGSAVMRLADADLLPFSFRDLAGAVESYVRGVKEAMRDKRAQAREHNLEITEGVLRATANPQQHLPAPGITPVPPSLKFASLDNAVAHLRKAAKEYHKLLIQAEADGGAAESRPAIKQVNELLRQSESAASMPEGLPGRPWYRNSLYAPGLYTGYAARTLPAIEQAIAQKDWELADAEILKTAAAIDREAQLIRKASQQLEETMK
ncbi:MAG: M28 family metallopeptidase, partial [Terriglobia bacterium]